MTLLAEIDRVAARAKKNGIVITRIIVDANRTVTIESRVTYAHVLGMALSRHKNGKYRFSPGIERELLDALADKDFANESVIGKLP